MIVVSDTSPIRALGFLQQPAILEQLFGMVVVPPAVASELRSPARPALGESPPDFRISHSSKSEPSRTRGV
jgi:predicted nucleic acid-binding protein